MLKRNKNIFFLFFGPTRIYLGPMYSH